MAVKKGLGTFKFPLVLNYQMQKSVRKSFKEATNPNKGEEGVLFKDEIRGNYGDDMFYLNLVSNPLLTRLDISIAVGIKYLIENNEAVYFGEVFWTSDSEQTSELGEDGEFWTEYEGQPNSQPSPLRNLKLELEKLNVFVKNETLITSLRKLHGLHYITITTKHGKGGEGDDPSVRSEIRHISIYEGMKTRKIFRVWRNG